MEQIGYLLLVITGAYLTGSLSLSFWWVKYVHKQDLRKYSSGSLGARNAGRVLGKIGFLVVFLFDFLKGFIAVFCASLIAADYIVISLATVFVIVGHVWPIFFGFKGGKGISVALGSLVALNPMILVYMLPPLVLVYLISKSIILAGLASFILLPVILILAGYSPSLYLPVSIGCLIVVWAHQSNIKSFRKTVESDK